MLSISSPHFFNWIEQLRNSGHKVYWLDIYDSNTKVEQIDFVAEIIGWRYKWDYPGRYFVKKNSEALTRLINIFNERGFQTELEKQIKKIQPDIVHSFVMYLAGVPALPVMQEFSRMPKVQWLGWINPFYFYNQIHNYILIAWHKTLILKLKNSNTSSLARQFPIQAGTTSSSQIWRKITRYSLRTNS